MEVLPPEVISELLIKSPWVALVFYFVRNITTRLDRVTSNLEKLTVSVDELKDVVKLQNERHDATEEVVNDLKVEIAIIKQQIAQ